LGLDATAEVDAAAVAADAGACPQDYQEIDGQLSLYRFSEEEAGWQDAETACEADGAGSHLIVVSASGELDLLAEEGQTDGVWVGVTNFQSLTTWRWVTGAEEDTMGDLLVGIGRCGGAGSGGLWIGLDCTRTRRYVCECDGGVPTHY
jgi:hypothetical protein